MTTDPDTLVDVIAARSEFEASVMVEALKARDIPAFAIANAGMTLQWEVAATAPFRVSVRSKDIAAAKEILRSVKADSVDIDWSEVDVGVNQDAATEKLGAQRADWAQSELVRWFATRGAPILIGLGLLLLLWNAIPRKSP
ncbi:MAG: hypothetical protein ACREJD_14105 [Phycisphaerales bacterium]